MDCKNEIRPKDFLAERETGRKTHKLGRTENILNKNNTIGRERRQR